MTWLEFLRSSSEPNWKSALTPRSWRRAISSCRVAWSLIAAMRSSSPCYGEIPAASIAASSMQLA